MKKTLTNYLLSVLLGFGNLLLISPLLLYWWIHGDVDRYLWIITGPYPYSDLGGGPFQIMLYVSLFGIGLFLIAIHNLLKKILKAK